MSPFAPRKTTLREVIARPLDELRLGENPVLDPFTGRAPVTAAEIDEQVLPLRLRGGSTLKSGVRPIRLKSDNCMMVNPGVGSACVNGRGSGEVEQVRY